MRLGRCLLLFSLSLGAQQSRDLKFEQDAPANPLRDKGTRWALVVGVSKYEHLPPGAQLQYAHRDAEEFAAFLRTPSGGALPSSHVRLLTNEGASLAQIRASLHTWLVQSAGPDDIVYLFFAGHGVMAERDEGYFVAQDSDPQNLHATALSFAEVDQTLTNRLRASLVVFAADACHAGRLGWSSYSPTDSSRAADAIQSIGREDRSFLKLLASKPSERSFEDARWDGGHGIFTHALLEGLRGRADRDSDRFVRASEVIDYISQQVPEQTGARQHPRVAGNFDARLALALLPEIPKPPASIVSLDVKGPAGSSIYLDHIFRGALRSDGLLRLEGLAPGPHAFAADLTDGTAIEGVVRLSAASSRVELNASGAVAQLRGLLNAGRVQEAWDVYRAQRFQGSQRAVATALLTAAVEQQGQACVSDYVQSAQAGPKRALLLRAVEGYEYLKTLRPDDPSVETRRLFCQGRLQIASNQFEQAVVSLRASLQRDPTFACAQNALGVALARTGRTDESRRAFEAAAALTPEWALPPFQIAGQLIAAGKVKEALPYLERAVKLSPQSRGNRWSLTRAYRSLGRNTEAQRAAEELVRFDPAYAPGHLELARVYEAENEPAKAAAEYEAYLLLAPNFGDSDEIRARSQRLRGSEGKKTPSLRRN